VKAAEDLAVLVQQRTWDKDLVLWLGSEQRLLDVLRPGSYQVLDLVDSFDEACLPMDDESTRSLLARELRDKLQSLEAGSGRRTILIVKSIALLARYGVGIREFYNWFCNDFRMAILFLEGPLEHADWPEEVICNNDLLLKYFNSPGMVKEVYRERG
jgi:hypothetical protein